MTTTTAKRKILVIDDDPVLRTLEQCGLTSAGHDTVTATNGSEAIDRMRETSFDLVIADLMMPVLSGLEFLRWLRQEFESTVPAVVFTSYDDEDVIEEARRAGATRVLRKPINLPQFLATVDELLNA